MSFVEHAELRCSVRRYAGIGVVMGRGGILEMNSVCKLHLVNSQPARIVTAGLGVGLPVALAALLASWLPSRRATRTDPLQALRAE